MPKPIQFPPELLAKFEQNRRTWRGWTMMADEATPPAGEQQANTNPETPQDGAGQPESGQPDDYKGAGGKDALKADLADERGKRQALEQQFADLKAGLAKALGIEPEQATPEQLAQQLQQANTDGAAKDAQIAALQQVLTVFTTAPAGVDVQALVDSRAFTDKLAADKPADIKAFVTQFAKDNPRFLRTAQSGGDLGEGHRTPPENVSPGVGRLAAAFEQQTKN